MNDSRPVPVLLMVHSLGHGGSERQLALIASALDRTRFEPHVASAYGGFHADRLRLAGIPVLELPIRSFLSARSAFVALGLRRYIREHGIRLVHTFDHTMSLFGVPVARTCRDVAILSSQRCYMEIVPKKYRSALFGTHRMADGIVANCKELKRHLCVDWKYPAERVHVCYNGLDTAVFSSGQRRRIPELEGSDMVIGTVCVLRREKNLRILIEAFARLASRYPAARLLIVGSGPERTNLLFEAERLGVKPACLFLPTTEDVVPALRSIDIFVHPSLTEGLPNAVMEAMACGCCVIATGVGGCPELIQSGETGLLVRPNELDELVNQLETVVGGSNLRASLAASASESMRSRFSVATSARRMEAIYDAYLDNRRPGAE